MSVVVLLTVLLAVIGLPGCRRLRRNVANVGPHSERRGAYRAYCIARRGSRTAFVAIIAASTRIAERTLLRIRRNYKAAVAAIALVGGQEFRSNFGLDVLLRRGRRLRLCRYKRRRTTLRLRLLVLRLRVWCLGLCCLRLRLLELWLRGLRLLGLCRRISLFPYRQFLGRDERSLALYALHVAGNTEMPAFGAIIVAVGGVESARRT